MIEKHIEPAEGETLTDAILREANHVSGCADDITVLRERILDFLEDLCIDRGWVPMFDLGLGTDCYTRWGKRSTLLLLSTMNDVLQFEYKPDGEPKAIALRPHIVFGPAEVVPPSRSI